MGEYTVTTGQNLYDIAMHTHGSIEGIVDLLIQNPQLSLEDKLVAGNKLQYTDDYAINEDIVAYNKAHGIIPAAGERHVYYKESGLPKVMEFHLLPDKTSAGFMCMGEGQLEIDWGDNTDLERLELGDKQNFMHHNFDTTLPDKRKIRFYGAGLLFRELNITEMQPVSVFFLRPVYAEKFIFGRANLNIGFISLLKGAYVMDLTGISTSSLVPLLRSEGLMKLELSNSHVKTFVLDEYLTALVKEYGSRRNCHIMLTTQPSGIYQEPSRDEAGNYILTTGMEAVWILTHEPSWNEAGYWKIQINNDLYTTQP